MVAPGDIQLVTPITSVAAGAASGAAPPAYEAEDDDGEEEIIDGKNKFYPCGNHNINNDLKPDPNPHTIIVTPT